MPMEERMKAVVVNCMYVSMYTEPDPASSYMCDISCLSNVYVVNIGNKNYYKVILHDGLTGYCEKRYLALKK